MRQDVTIVGSGLAASCCAHLLKQAGLAVAWEKGRQSTVPALLISRASLD